MGDVDLQRPDHGEGEDEDDGIEQDVWDPRAQEELLEIDAVPGGKVPQRMDGLTFDDDADFNGDEPRRDQSAGRPEGHLEVVFFEDA